MTTTLQITRKRTIAPGGRWTVDARHSSLEFAVKPVVFATVKGRFRDFEGTLEVDEATGDVRAHGTVKVESIDTGSPERDRQLLSADFLDLERHPELRYTLLAFRRIEDNRFRSLGEITICGVTCQIPLDGGRRSRGKGGGGGGSSAGECAKP
jgi:polyisoprenoid-binding protein YceI